MSHNGNAAPRIAIFLPRFSRYGGVEQFGARLAELMAKKGWQVDFICARQEAEAPSGVRGLHTGRPGGPQFFKMLWFCVGAEILRRKGRYDCSLSLGKTWNQDILRVGGGPLRTFWKLSSLSYPRGLPRLWKSIRRRLSPANWLTLKLERRQFNGKTKLIAVSHLVRDWTMENFPRLSPDQFTIVYNKPDLKRYFPPSPMEKSGARILFDVPDNAKAIGTASSNFQLKGVAPLIRALSLLPENHHLYIAGGRGHKHYDALARTLRVEKRVHFLGALDRMAAFYHALDLFILPSFYDACSNAVLEAKASGIPTLSSATNGSAHFLTPDEIIPNPADYNELADRIQTALQKNAPPPFIWPENILAGPEGVCKVIESFLARKNKD